MVAFVATVDADDRPSWAIIDAADRLIAKNALVLPGGDGFLKQPSGLLVQYERPSKSYSRDGKNWMIEIRSPRWRAEAAKEWQPWNPAHPNYDHWRIGVIRVEVLISGVEASWVDNTNFSGRTPPSQSEVMHRLDTLGQASVRAPDIHQPRTNQGAASEIRPHTGRTEQPTKGGIFKKLPNGTLQKISPQQTPMVPIPGPMRPIPSPQTRAIPPPVPSPPQVEIPPDPVPPLPSNASRFELLGTSFGWVIASFALALTTIFGIGFTLIKMRRKTTTPSNTHSNPESIPNTSSFTSASLQTNQTTLQSNKLISPPESSFLNTLQKVFGPSFTIATKIRTSNLFSDDSSPEKEPSPASSHETHIDFVIYHPSESRILCAIELDDNSRSRHDPLKPDSFLTELFESKQVPLLRVPISWTYFPQGIRDELQKAGIFSDWPVQR